MNLRTGITTGTCAAAAAKAAVAVLLGNKPPREVPVRLPSQQEIAVPVESARRADRGAAAIASVIKDAGDDPDVTHGLKIRAKVRWIAEGVQFVGGAGVGVVTRPGLQVDPGEPAINPGPRRMITEAVRELTDRGVSVEISVPGGREIAKKTFNPRLGIVGGISILGTTGIVRPYCAKALYDALECALDVAQACGVAAPVFVPGAIGARAAEAEFDLAKEQVIEVGNAWGYALDALSKRSPCGALLVVGHPGKLAKLAAGEWDTHSSRSASPTAYLADLCVRLLGRQAPDAPTTEGMFKLLRNPARTELAAALAGEVRQAVWQRIGGPIQAAVVLVDMAGNVLATSGDLSPWR